VGKGSYGADYKARDRRDGATVAVKVIAVDTDLRALLAEIQMTFI
jgi:hypothetical protein